MTDERPLTPFQQQAAAMLPPLLNLGVTPNVQNRYVQAHNAARDVIAAEIQSNSGKAPVFAQIYTEFLNDTAAFVRQPPFSASGHPLTPQMIEGRTMAHWQEYYRTRMQHPAYKEAFDKLGNYYTGPNGILGQFWNNTPGAQGDDSIWNHLKIPGILGGLVGGLLFTKLFKQPLFSIGGVLALLGGAIMGATGTNIAWDYISRMVNGNQANGQGGGTNPSFAAGSPQEQEYYNNYAPRLAQAYQRLADQAAGTGKVVVTTRYDAANRRIELSVEPGPRGSAATLMADIQRIATYSASHSIPIPPFQTLAPRRFGVTVTSLQALPAGPEGLLTAINAAMPRAQALENHGNPGAYYPSLPAGLGQPPTPPRPGMQGGR